MDINIRNYIKDNFKDSEVDEIKASIENSIVEKDDITLPGLGVFFEILWQNSDENSKEFILNTLKNSFNWKKMKKKVDFCQLLD